MPFPILIPLAIGAGLLLKSILSDDDSSRTSSQEPNEPYVDDSQCQHGTYVHYQDCKDCEK